MEPMIRRVQAAKQNPQAMESLLKAYRPLLVAEVRFHMHSIREEYLQIAREAFCEAVYAYHPERGAFLPLCRRVVAVRLIDEKRRRKLWHEAPMADLGEERASALMDAASLDAHARHTREEERHEEILAYARALQDRGLTLPDVQRASPKHADTRAMCRRAIQLLSKDANLADRTRAGRLPIARLCEAFQTGDKIWERHRRYLIAALIALDGNYPVIASYILRGEERA